MFRQLSPTKLKKEEQNKSESVVGKASCIIYINKSIHRNVYLFKNEN